MTEGQCFGNPNAQASFFQVMILITGAHKAFALYKAIEEGVNHMWTVSAFQQHPRTIFVCDEDATLELRVKTVKYFKGQLFSLILRQSTSSRLHGPLTNTNPPPRMQLLSVKPPVLT